jgi:hypothetical protein
VIPSGLVQIFVAESETAAQSWPLHAIPPYPNVDVVIGAANNIHDVPFVLNARELLVPPPNTRIWFPFHPMRYPPVVNVPAATVRRLVQLTPSGLVAIEFVPVPTAIQSLSLSIQRTSKPAVEKMVVVVRPVHVTPSGLVAMEFVP